jgi:hypothetical protein
MIRDTLEPAEDTGIDDQADDSAPTDPSVPIIHHGAAVTDRKSTPPSLSLLPFPPPSLSSPFPSSPFGPVLILNR